MITAFTLLDLTLAFVFTFFIYQDVMVMARPYDPAKLNFTPKSLFLCYAIFFTMNVALACSLMKGVC